MEIVVKDEDRFIEYQLEVDPRCDDLGRYVEPNTVRLTGGVLWCGKQGVEISPTLEEERSAGRWVEMVFRNEIDAAVREKIEREAAGV
jgi:hypothetical protein